LHHRADVTLALGQDVDERFAVERDRWFESGSLQRRVRVISAKLAERQAAFIIDELLTTVC